MGAPMIVAVAPNGAHRGAADHPALPITPAAIAREARACLEAGAAMLHLHVRDSRGRHSLGAGAYRAALAALDRAVGRALLIQITTEAGGRYRPAQQLAAVRALRPEAVSLAIRELAPAGDAGAADVLGEFLRWARDNSVSPQFILYDEADAARFEELGAAGVIPGAGHAVLRVYGKPGPGGDDAPARPAIEPPLRGAWMLCGFDAGEFDCVRAAAADGGHARVGFENNLKRPDGRSAAGNAEAVAWAAEQAAGAGRPLADAEQARRIMAPAW